MTNQEKYKTAEERDKAFKASCIAQENCSQCPIKTSSIRCQFLWLEQEVSRLAPCPFCGGEARFVRMVEGQFGDEDNGFVKCLKCGIEQPCANTRSRAIAAWNRRTKKKGAAK